MNFQYRQLAAICLEMRRESGYRPSYGAVYTQLLHWENAATGWTCPAQGALARSLGYARETVNRACAWLEAHGYIRSQQRYRRIMRNAVRFLSKRYWIAKERGQVAWMLAHLTARARKLRNRAETALTVKKFSSDRDVTPPSRTELNPAEIEALRLKFQLRWKE